jgi:hypothetical protein
MKRILFILTFIGCLIFFPPSRNAESPPIQQSVFLDSIILHIIRVESNYNTKAVSEKGAIGLCQIMPVWIPELKKAGIIESKQCLFHPEKNKKAGKFVLAYYLRKNKGDLKKTLADYSNNTKDYYKKVLKD